MSLKPSLAGAERALLGIAHHGYALWGQSARLAYSYIVLVASMLTLTWIAVNDAQELYYSICLLVRKICTDMASSFDSSAYATECARRNGVERYWKGGWLR